MAKKPGAALTPQPPAGRLPFDQVVGVGDNSISGTRDTPLPLKMAASTLNTPGPASVPLEARSGAVLTGEGSLTVNADVVSADGGARSAALIANRELIVINVEALLLLLDDKIATLERANSDEARTGLEQYRHVRQELAKLRRATIAFATGEVLESDAIDASISFLQGIRNWWDKHHVEICNTAFSASVFLSCLEVCELTGADANLAVVVSGVIAKGKSITDALSAAADVLFGRNKKH